MSRPEDPPSWAVEQAAAELYDSSDEAAITQRAWEIARDTAQRRSERHDRYDDPDAGGES